MRQVIFGLAVIGIAALPACSTFDGVGKDISAAGRGVSHVANEVREEVFTPRNYASRRPVARAGEPCDASAGELAGGSGLPPCPRASQAPAPIDLRRR